MDYYIWFTIAALLIYHAIIFRIKIGRLETKVEILEQKIGVDAYADAWEE